MNWCIYYDDRTTYADTDGPMEESPGYGVLAVKDGETILCSQDFYIYRDDYGCWIEVHIEGLIDHLVTGAHHVRCVRAGRTVPLEVFKAVLKDIPVNERRFYGNR